MTCALALATGCAEAGAVPRVASDAAAHIGAQISAERLRVGMTQDQLAAVSGIDSSNIRAYENGRAMPNLHTLVRLAEGLGSSPAVLLAGVTAAMFPETAASRRLPDNARRRA